MQATDRIGDLIQMIMKDPTIPHAERAYRATRALESAVRADYGLSPDVPLPVPPEWRHRVMSEPTLRARATPLEFWAAEPEGVDAFDKLLNGLIFAAPSEISVRVRKPWWRRDRWQPLGYVEGENS